jgi:hypothetical protein
LVFIRLLQLLMAAVLLNGCTFFFDVRDGGAQSEATPDARQKRIIADQVYKITEQMKQAGAVEISDVGTNEAQSGPEKWTVCTRSNFPTGWRYFAFFLKGETVVNWRPAVINDGCEARSFSPLAHPG